MAKERTGFLGRLSRRGRGRVEPASARQSQPAAAAATTAPAPKAAPARRPAAAKKASPAKKPAPVPKSDVAKKLAPATKSSPTKKPAAAKTATKKAAAKKAAPTKATAPAKKAAAKKVAPTKATAPTKKAAPATKAAPSDPARTEVAASVVSKAGLLPRLPGDSPWTSKEVAAVRDMLLAEATDLSQEISEASAAYDRVLAEGDQGTGDDSADAGSATFEREHELSLTANSRDLLAQNTRALERLDAGTYGLCEICGNPIGKARLKAFPKVTLCVTCKQRENRR